MHAPRLQSISGQQQGDTLGPLLFALGLQPAFVEVHKEFPGVIIRAYIDDIHLSLMRRCSDSFS